MKTIYIALVAVIVAACASTGIPRAKTPMGGPPKVDADLAEPGWNDAMCFDLMNERDNWRFIGAFFSGIGGAGAISGAASAEETDSKWARWGVGIAAGLSGAAGAAAVLVSASKSDTFEAYCQMDNEPLAGLGLPEPGTNPLPTRTVEKLETTADGGTDGGE